MLRPDVVRPRRQAGATAPGSLTHRGDRQAVLAELGYKPEDVKRLVAEGAVESDRVGERVSRDRGGGMSAWVQIVAGLAALAAAPAAALAEVQQISTAPANSTPEIYDDELVDGLPGPDGLYDLYDGEPQSLLPEPPPREVVFPGLGLPFQKERRDFRKWLFDNYGLTYAASYQQLSQYATRTLPGASWGYAVGGWAATSVTWTPIDRGGPNEGSLVVSGGWRGPLAPNPCPAPFGPGYLGMAWSSYTFTSWQANYRIENFYWDQKIGGDLIIRVGNQPPQAVLNTFRFKNRATKIHGEPARICGNHPLPDVWGWRFVPLAALGLSRLLPQRRPEQHEWKSGPGS